MKLRASNSPEISEITRELQVLRHGFRLYRRGVVLKIIPRIFFAFFIFLNGPERFAQTIQKHHGIAFPFWAYCTLYLMFFLVGVVFIWIGFDLYKPSGWQKYPVRAQNLEKMLLLAERCGKEELDVLLSTVWVARGGLYKSQQDRFDEIVAPRILALEPEEAAALGRDARAWLRERAKNSHVSTMRIAALLILSELGDRRVQEIAKNLRFSADERVQAAAEEVLRARGGAA